MLSKLFVKKSFPKPGIGSRDNQLEPGPTTLKDFPPKQNGRPFTMFDCSFLGREFCLTSFPNECNVSLDTDIIKKQLCTRMSSHLELAE